MVEIWLTNCTESTIKVHYFKCSDNGGCTKKCGNLTKK